MSAAGTTVRALVRWVRWLDELLRDLGHKDWRERRAVRRDLDRRLAAWRALPPEEQAGYVHPASPQKPPGWSAERYIAARKRPNDTN